LLLFVKIAVFFRSEF